MRLPDVNVLVYAHRSDAARHQDYADWLRGLLAGPEPYGISDLVLSGFLRIVTNPKVFRQPTPVETGLCRSAGVKGNLVPDAYLAALAIESGSEWVTTDRDFSRFPGLRWRHPLR